MDSVIFCFLFNYKTINLFNFVCIGYAVFFVKYYKNKGNVGNKEVFGKKLAEITTVEVSTYNLIVVWAYIVHLIQTLKYLLIN